MELDWWSDSDGCVCAYSEWVIMFSLDLVFMSVKLQVSASCPEIHSHAVLSHTYINTQALHIHTHTKHSCSNKCGPTGSYTQEGKHFYKWHVVDVYTHIYIFRGRQTSHTHSIHARGWHLRPVTCLDDMLRSQHCASRNRRSRRSLEVSPAPVSACKAKVNLL